MGTKKSLILSFISLAIAVLIWGCTKTTADTSSLYTPTSSDVTATATLQQLQQGRTLYLNNCNACHSLYSPDSFTPSQWKSILSAMAPRTSLNSADILLVTKYVTKGN
jgi:cytochrome c5